MRVIDLELNGHTLVKGRGKGGTLSNRFLGTSASGS